MCGARGTIHVTEHDPATGWHTLHWYCSRHRQAARRVENQLAAQNEAAPEPIPNRGGLLACYFKADWEAVYRWAVGSWWTPPSYGISADDWPTPGRDPLPGHTRLRLVLPIGDGGLDDGGTSGGTHRRGRPTTRLAWSPTGCSSGTTEASAPGTSSTA